MNPHTDSPAEAPVDARKRRSFRAQAWIGGGSFLVVAALVAGTVAWAGHAAQESAPSMEEARGRHSAAVAALSALSADAEAARARYVKASERVGQVMADLDETADTLAPGLVEPRSALADVSDAAQQVEQALSAAEDLTAGVTQVFVAEVQAEETDVDEVATSSTVEELTEAAARTEAAAADAQAAVKTYRDATGSLTDAEAAAKKTVTALVKAVIAKSATVKYPKADKAARVALAKAKKKVAALTAGGGVTSISRTNDTLRSYAKAVARAKKSHNANVAKAKRDTTTTPGTHQTTDNNTTRNSSSSHGSSTSRSDSKASGSKSSPSKGSKSSGSKASGSKGSGSKGSSSKGSGSKGSSEPACYGNQEHACEKTPPTFSTNSDFVGYASCRGRGLLESHNVGYGGRSLTGGNNFDFPWSAYVEGPTVYYVACR